MPAVPQAGGSACKRPPGRGACWRQAGEAGEAGEAGWSRLLSDPRQPPLQRTARESPVLEQMMCVGESNVITAVEPLWSLPVSTSGSARISACRFVLAAAIGNGSIGRRHSDSRPL